jgi:pimeloyl-ACP methyl ester carboxylesterase
VIKAGMPALVITYRNDEGAPRDSSGYYRYGATEWQDLDNAVVYALEHGARRVVLFGFSMGGGIVASFLEHRPERATHVAGIVLDAPILNFRRTVGFGAAQRELPVIGGSIPAPLIWTAETIASLRYGIDWERIDYLDGQWLSVPALVLHGTADKTVPIATSDAFAAAFPQLVREIRVPGAGHVEAWNTDPGRYTTEVSAFLRRVAGG